MFSSIIMLPSSEKQENLIQLSLANMDLADESASFALSSHFDADRIINMFIEVNDMLLNSCNNVAKTFGA
jgi:hypothetical protein